MRPQRIALVAGLTAVILANYLALFSPLSPLSPLVIPLLTETFGNYWLDEFLVVLLAGALLLGVEFWVESRKRVRIEIEPVARAERLGFRITVRGGALHSPEVTRSSSVFSDLGNLDSTPLTLSDQFGNPMKNDYVLADGVFYVFPFVAKHCWKEESRAYTLIVSVRDYPNDDYRAELRFEGLDPSSQTTIATAPTGHWDVTLRVQADGWGRVETHFYNLRLRAYITNLDLLSTISLQEEPVRKSKPEDWKVTFRLLAEEVKDIPRL